MSNQPSKRLSASGRFLEDTQNLGSVIAAQDDGLQEDDPQEDTAPGFEDWEDDAFFTPQVNGFLKQANKQSFDKLAELTFDADRRYSADLLQRIAEGSAVLDEIDAIPWVHKPQALGEFRCLLDSNFKKKCRELPKLPGLLIGGFSIECTMPVISMKGTKPGPMSGTTPRMGSIPPFLLKPYQGCQLEGGLFSFQVAVTAHGPSGGQLDGWKICLHQNARGRRVATYSNGAKICQSIDEWCVDVVGEEVPLALDKPTVAVLHDAPKWQWFYPKQPVMLSSIEIADEFRVFVVVTDGDGAQHSILEFAWTATGNASGSVYAPGQLQMLSGKDAGRLVTSGAKANATEMSLQ